MNVPKRSSANGVRALTAELASCFSLDQTERPWVIVFSDVKQMRFHRKGKERLKFELFLFYISPLQRVNAHGMQMASSG